MSNTVCNRIDCTGCYACASICPENCISMTKEIDGFLYPIVDETKCVKCNLCVKTCPVIHNDSREYQSATRAYAAINNNESVRLNSSSGGVFSLLAESVIKRGGVVFGAAFDDDFNVKTICVESESELQKLRGSKYLQSKIGSAYVQAKKILEDDRIVLFSGTPCQIGGLRSFLHKDYEKLFTIDLVCHGVPSPRVWNKYLEYRQSVAQSEISNISFRDKRSGWNRFSITFDFLDNTSYSQKAVDDAYMMCFLNNYCLRSSCYHCSFKGLKRESDITLADFWGIEKINPKFTDDKGTSLVLVNTQKGFDEFTTISEGLEYTEVELDRSCEFNSALLYSVYYPKEREWFIKYTEKRGFKPAYRKLRKTIRKKQKTNVYMNRINARCIIIKSRIKKVFRT